MKSTGWIIPALVLLCCGTVAPAAAGPSTPPSAESIKIQEARLPQIEAVAARDREQVQQWYQSRRAELVRQIARPEAAQLTSAQRSLWVQYAGLYSNRAYTVPYFNPGWGPSLQTAVLADAMIEEYLISEMADLLADGDFERKLERLVDERLAVGIPSVDDRSQIAFTEQALLQTRAQELLIIVRRVRTQIAIESTQLENQRNARLDAIMKWEEDLKGQVRDILNYLRQRESRPVQLGAVEAVGYCPTGGYYCMIEGVDRVLAVGDRVGDIRVLKIDAEKVEFAKDGTTWAQSLGAAPQAQWE
jgi:hypothetical protein